MLSFFSTMPFDYGYYVSVKFSVSLSVQEAEESLLYIKLSCPGSEEAVKVPFNDENYVPETVEDDKSKCFGSFCLERLKSHS